jgi:trehalose/maltose transport system substrate-binding protein
MWAAGGRTSIDRVLVDEFTRRTGVSVYLVPASESSSRRFNQELSVLQDDPAAVDVLQVDPIWAVRLAPRLLDLRGQLASYRDDELPEVVENVTFDGRVVGAPMLVSYGLLYYRTDLLKKYGFAHPPASWNELEQQARRIQRGERAAGDKEFWGYVWQGGDYEGLTCNALEWQYSAGGSNFVSHERRANTANSQAIGAFSRAASWVGTISPPGVTGYVEEDSRNVWQSGHAAFLRNWGYVYSLAMRSPEVGGRFAATALPTGLNSSSTVLGGWYLAVPATSRHRSDALAFVEFMTSNSAQKQRALHGSLFPTLKSVYRDVEVRRSNPVFGIVDYIADHAVRRPAAVAGLSYSCVSRVYAHGVHEIISGAIAPAIGATVMDAQIKAVLAAPAQDCR